MRWPWHVSALVALLAVGALVFFIARAEMRHQENMAAIEAGLQQHVDEDTYKVIWVRSPAHAGVKR